MTETPQLAHGSATWPIPSLESLSRYVTAHLVDGSCWEWRGSLSSAGNPKMTVEHQTTSVSVRRVIWIMFLGPLGGGLHPDLSDPLVEFVSLKCGNRKCLRPSHFIKWRKSSYVLLSNMRKGDKYEGIGPRLRQRPLAGTIIAERCRAERVIQLKRTGLSNRAVAEAVGLSLSQIERIISGSVFSFLNRSGLRDLVKQNAIVNRRRAQKLEVEGSFQEKNTMRVSEAAVLR